MTVEQVRAYLAKRDAVLESLTTEQRLAVYDWLDTENDYGEVLASWQWAEAWIGDPGQVPSWDQRTTA